MNHVLPHKYERLPNLYPKPVKWTYFQRGWETALSSQALLTYFEISTHL